MFNTQDEHLHYYNATGSISNYPILQSHDIEGVSVSSVSWSTNAKSLSLTCKQTATSTAVDAWTNNTRDVGSFDTAFYCPYHLYLTTNGAGWIGITTVGRDYQTTKGEPLVQDTTATAQTTYQPATPAVSAGFTYGEIMITTLLFYILVLGVYAVISRKNIKIWK
jgi:hypothetical protein